MRRGSDLNCQEDMAAVHNQTGSFHCSYCSMSWRHHFGNPMTTDLREGKVIMHNCVCPTHRNVIYSNSSVSQNQHID